MLVAWLARTGVKGFFPHFFNTLLDWIFFLIKLERTVFCLAAMRMEHSFMEAFWHG
ncbi:hypothetical protein RI056_06790 [Komagataeibacter nataicola]|uniref:hypothetical protein n=1 Tax=Komagataeibacter nataicola TaxID=265960 RepID=UPI00197B613A|nr:hypothetical protein [Komagataeibacter nataicola]WNM09627.1 hypothetical protein RI056_06790 [Komagataeibacter nataicola]